MTEQSQAARSSDPAASAFGFGRSQPDPNAAVDLPLPDTAALLTRWDGTIVGATAQAAALVGVESGAELVGLDLTEVVEFGGESSFIRNGYRDIQVRLVSWPHVNDNKLQVSVLVDLTDAPGNSARTVSHDVATEHETLLEAQDISKVGAWALYPKTGQAYNSPQLLAIADGAGAPSGPSGSFDLIHGVHIDDQAKALTFWEDLSAGPHGQVFDVELRSISGKRVFLCSAKVERDDNGQIDRIIGTVQDVTDVRRLERQLREERQRLHDAQRIARLGTWEWDPQTARTWSSEMLLEVTGRQDDQFGTFLDDIDHVHSDDRDRVREAWKSLAAGGAPVEIEYRYLRRDDGAVRTFRSHGAATVHADGRTILVGTTQDVTEQRTAVTRMERSSQRFSDLVSVTPVGIGVFDQAERLVDANDALCDLLGYRLDQLRGMSTKEMAHSDELVTGLQGEESGKHGRHRLPQRLFVRADGHPVYCELHVATSVQDDGETFWLVVFQDVTERRRAAEALRYQATHDELTGLPNRAAVKELLGRLLGKADSERVAVLFCDIDKFKRVNDSLGHDAGDELLVALARRLEGGLPGGCTAARLSGDEFLIICPDIEAVGGVDALATKVASLLRTAVPVHGQLVRVSASIGAAVPSSGTTGGEDLFRFADAAMFEAKRRGAGRVSLASPALMASADRQLHLEGQLREALHNDGLELHYQPVVAGDGSIASAEALARWPHPDRGLLGPGAFLPVAEQGDLLRDLDRWALRTALREAAQWPLNNGRPVSIAVNLAALVPGDREFVDTITSTVDECGIDPNRVILELVETALVDLPSRSRQAMGELSGRGLRFAVDDFGTGYSSLARLKDLPAQIIKVDRSFVSGVGGDASDFAVARAVVDMARAMGRQCVAEGVETATQFHVLSGVGVDFYQGWLFSRAIPAREFRTILSLGPLDVPRGT